MADESPEQIRERVYQEELDKGSEPRVAEGRSKAAELRAKQGLPIEPKEAAKAKLEKEGAPPGVTGEEPAAEEAAPEAPPEPEEPEEPEREEAPEEPEPEEPEEPEGPEEPDEPREPERPAARAAEVPAAVSIAPEAPEAAPVPRPGVEPAEPAFEPEIGEPLEEFEQDLVEMAGIKMREGSVSRWVTVALVALMVWAALYVVVFGGTERSAASGCELSADRSFTCFIDLSGE